MRVMCVVCAAWRVNIGGQSDVRVVVGIIIAIIDIVIIIIIIITVVVVRWDCSAAIQSFVVFDMITTRGIEI